MTDTDELISQHSHVREHIEEHKCKSNPDYVETVEEVDYPNIIYQVTNLVFIHIYADIGDEIEYNIIEPIISDKQVLDRVRDTMTRQATNYSVPDGEIEKHITRLLDDCLVKQSEATITNRVKERLGTQVILNEETHQMVRYTMRRNIAGIRDLQPVMEDSHNEDIHVIGSDECYVDHSEFGLIETDINFGTKEEFDRYLKNLGERIDNPLSDSEPIVDSTLPDGSRLNVIYSDDVSVKGSSLTIRQGDEVPLSILQITKWGTLSPKMAAYLWLCLENEQSVFVVGETASGKTTTLNAILSFIENDSKIYTAEDTAEVLPPQDAWQQLLTRETPGENSTDVDMFDLVEAALRSRPDYIVVGEVRGAEAKMAFQAAQTGHPVLLTFHASDIKSMIQRFTSNPLNVPKPFMPIADVALFQNRVKRDDGEILRRVTNVTELVSYDEERDGIATQNVFDWDSADDEHNFVGQNSSYVLEEQVAELLGYEDRRKIYSELERRTEIIERLIENDVLQYEEVNNTIDKIQQDGVETVNIDTSGLIK